MSKHKHYIADSKLKSRDKIVNESLDISAIKSLIDESPYLVNQPEDKLGWTFLYKAVILENYDLCEFLLERKANPNIQNAFGETPLHQAVETSNNKIINLLLENGADTNIQQKDGETALHIACIKGDYKILKLLLIYGANPILKSFQNNYTPLDYAIEKNHTKCIQILGPILDNQKLQKQPSISSANNDLIAASINTFSNKHIDQNNKQMFSPKREVKGFQSTKNNEDPQRLKNMIDFNMPQSVNNIHNSSKNKGKNLKEVKEVAFDESLKKPSKIQASTLNQDVRDSTNFMDEMVKFEQKLEKIKLDLLKVNNMQEDSKSHRENETNDSNHRPHVRYNSNFDHTNMNELWQNFGRNDYTFSSTNNKHNNEPINNSHQHKSHFVGGSYNFENNELEEENNFYENNENEIIEEKESSPETLSKYKTTPVYVNEDLVLNNNYTFNMGENRTITLKPEDEDENEYEGSPQLNQNESRITYTTNKEDNSIPILKLSKMASRNQVSDSYFQEERATIKSTNRNLKSKGVIKESFIDTGYDLAKFSSARNDIDEEANNEDNYKEMKNQNILRSSAYFHKGSNYIEEEEENNQENVFTEKYDHHGESLKNVKYFSKSKELKEEFKQISLNTDLVANDDISLVYKKSCSQLQNELEEDEDYGESAKEIFHFLKGIEAEIFTSKFMKNGFDELALMIEQMKSINPLTDVDLKQIGIVPVGLRARILIKLEEGIELSKNRIKAL